MLTLKDVLFPEITSITYISSNEQKGEIDVINHVKAFARTTSYGICVLDFKQGYTVSIRQHNTLK